MAGRSDGPEIGSPLDKEGLFVILDLEEQGKMGSLGIRINHDGATCRTALGRQTMNINEMTPLKGRK